MPFYSLMLLRSCIPLYLYSIQYKHYMIAATQLFPTSWQMMMCWQLEFIHCGSIYITKMV